MIQNTRYTSSQNSLHTVGGRCTQNNQISFPAIHNFVNGCHTFQCHPLPLRKASDVPVYDNCTAVCDEYEMCIKGAAAVHLLSSNVVCANGLEPKVQCRESVCIISHQRNLCQKDAVLGSGFFKPCPLSLNGISTKIILHILAKIKTLVAYCIQCIQCMYTSVHFQ